MRYPLADQHRLLELQAADAELRLVSRRLRASPAAAEVSRVEQQQDDLRRLVVTARTEMSDLDRAVQRMEDDLERVRTRLERDRAMADQGVAARVQRDLEHELGSLTRRLSDLEDAELELMQRQEDLEKRIVELQGQERDLGERLTAARELRDTELGQLRARHDELTRTRAGLAAPLPADLLSAFERAARDTGTGAALLRGNQCQGCRLELPPSETARLRAVPPDQIEFCDECGCIIVRESP